MHLHLSSNIIVGDLDRCPLHIKILNVKARFIILTRIEIASKNNYTAQTLGGGRRLRFAPTQAKLLRKYRSLCLPRESTPILTYPACF